MNHRYATRNAHGAVLARSNLLGPLADWTRALADERRATLHITDESGRGHWTRRGVADFHWPPLAVEHIVHLAGVEPSNSPA